MKRKLTLMLALLGSLLIICVLGLLIKDIRDMMTLIYMVYKGIKLIRIHSQLQEHFLLVRT